jgi:hypothetical protein
MPVASRSARADHLRDRNAFCVRKGTVRSFMRPPANHVMHVNLGRWRSFLPARPHGRKEWPTCGGDRGSRALASLGHQVSRQ